MPKLKCKCGFVHDLSPIPDDGWITIKDKDYDNVIDAEIFSLNFSDKSKEIEKLKNSDETISSSKGLLYECPKCERIMWEKPGSDCFETYSKEK